jgi:hypothetical protein
MLSFLIVLGVSGFIGEVYKRVQVAKLTDKMQATKPGWLPEDADLGYIITKKWVVIHMLVLVSLLTLKYVFGVDVIVLRG